MKISGSSRRIGVRLELKKEFKGGKRFEKMQTTYLWKPRPSMRMTTQVLGRRMSGWHRSKLFTYSYLDAISPGTTFSGLCAVQTSNLP